MDLQGTQRVNEVEGAFRAPRYGRPDPKREPDAYMRWLIADRELPRAPGELEPLPWIEDAYTIGPIAAPAERKWFVVVTDPAKERSVCDDLRREGVEPFAPLVRSLITRKGKKCVMTRPLLPRYVFAGLPQQPQTPFRVILEAHGAREILGHSGSPAAIPASIVEDLRQRDADGEWDDSLRQAKGYGKEPAIRRWKWIKPGALAIVAKDHRHFAYHNAIIEQVDSGRKIAKAGVSLFGRVTLVEFSFDQLESV